MQRRMIFAAAGVCALAAGTVPAVLSTASATTTTPPLRFSHEVVVDHQRNGFEPDILADSKDRLYTSVPNGSSEATSFIWSSIDHGNSFQLVPGSVGHGKPLTCPQGGGDTELQLDGKDNLFFSDLQNLTNLSNSVSTDHGSTFSTQCVAVPNTPVDRMWYAVHGSLGDPGFAIYEEYDAVVSGTNPGDPNAPTNQLVETVSHDGINFQPVINANPGPDCLGAGVVNCVTDDEGISGNQTIAPNGDLLIAHTSEDSNQVVVSRGKLSAGPGGTTQATWTNTVVNASLCPDKAGTAPGTCGATQFATIAKDTTGHFYVSFSSRPEDASGNQVGPYNVYVVSSADGVHWGKPVRVSTTGSNSFSWVTAGSDGRAAVAWYHANESHEGTGYTFDDLQHAEFSVQVGESLNAHSTTPHYTVATVSEHPIKYGPICTGGLGCTVSMGDRSLGDFLEVSHDNRGALILSYVDDTSNTYTTGPTGAVAENGPPVVVRQVSGPGLLGGTISGTAGGPGAPYTSVTDPTGDDNYSANAMRTPAGANLDLTSAAIRQDATGLNITMKLKSLASLAVSPTAGGTTGEWITRFTTYNPHTPGNGHIYYAGMESEAGGTPRFFDGDVAAPSPAGAQISMVFDSSHAVSGHYNPATNEISIHVPAADVPGVVQGAKLYSATAFTGTTIGTLASNPAGFINLTDATTPFDVNVTSSAFNRTG